MSQQSNDGSHDLNTYHLDDDARWLDWPSCPECGRNRQTYCPTCDIAGDQFPLAEYIPAAAPVQTTRRDTGCACKSCGDGRGEGHDEDHAPVLLMCPSCDEAFAPKFFRLCEECGHDFGDGRQVESSEPEELSERALYVIVAIGALTLGLLAYWWYLFQA
ncbi:MAG: hypothetical protein H8E44_47275 [Planctomycetes bacterium]|nr:hypothetical protein [Planctomycetota bacterium]MBL7037954.1 hypothetical protein [Pirellulaceae bacterium]